jgi:hypothetical protein
MGELWSVLLLIFFFGSSYLMIDWIERVQWRAGDRK